jgi:hypothetical protein
MKFDISKLKTIKNYAVGFGVTASYIYKLIKEQKMESIEIDGVQFIDVVKFSKLPTKK